MKLKTFLFKKSFMSFTLEEEVGIIHVETQWNPIQHVGVEVVDDHEKVESQHWKNHNQTEMKY